MVDDTVRIMIITRDEAVKALNGVNRVSYLVFGVNQKKVTLDFARTKLANVKDTHVLTRSDITSSLRQDLTHIFCREENGPLTWALTLYR